MWWQRDFDDVIAALGHGVAAGWRITSQRRKSASDFTCPKDEMVHLTRENSNSLFEVLEEWERHLEQLDLNGLGVRDENPHP